MRTLNVMAATALVSMATGSALAQTPAPAKKGPSDVPMKCRTLSDPELSQCIRDSQTAPETSKQEPMRKREDTGTKSGTPTPATPPPSTKGGKPGEG